MDLGISLPPWGPADALVPLAQTAERAGLTSAFVSDHIVLFEDLQSKYPYSKTGEFAMPPTAPFFEPLAVLAALVGATSTLRLGTSVLILPYRNPVFTAKFISSLDQLSGGRIIFGVGSGWMKEEFEALDAPFHKRGKMTDEWLQIFHACFTEDAPAFEGEFYSFAPLKFEPKPAQSPMAIWVGGHVKPALRRTAKYGTGWHATYRGNDELEQLRDDLARACDAEGRDIDELELSIRGPLIIRDEPRGRFQGPPEHLAENLKILEGLGFTHYVFESGQPDGHAAVAAVERIGADLLPLL